jgi:hypothetical protein
LVCDFPLSFRRRLERSELFAEPRLAQLSSHKRALHTNAALCILEYQPVAVSPNRDAVTAADGVNVVPAS